MPESPATSPTPDPEAERLELESLGARPGETRAQLAARLEAEGTKTP